MVPRRFSVVLVWWALGPFSVWADPAAPSNFEGHSIPDELCSPYGTYPNLLNITESDQQFFYPVVIYPDLLIPINDWRNAQTLASPEEIDIARKRNAWWKVLSRRVMHNMISVVTFGKRTPGDNQNSPHWSIGKYDENRVGMYTSELFEDTSNTIDGYGGKRTVHLGIDLGAPAGTKAYAFCDGVIHSAGYNADFGDYGYVVVIEHHLPTHGNAPARRVWALYGHMDKGSVRGKRPGKVVKKGKVIGRVGGCHENGGWAAPHLHFQLSVNPPETHDMPGASSIEDRKSALMDYPDPRYVLGVVH